MSNLAYPAVSEQAEWIIPFLCDLLKDKDLPSVVTLGDIQDWCEIDHDFAIAVTLALGFDKSSFDVAADTIVTRENMKTALADLGYDFDLEEEKKRLTDLLKTYEGAVRECGNEPRFRICKAANTRLRDEVAADLEQLALQYFIRKNGG